MNLKTSERPLQDPAVRIRWAGLAGRPHGETSDRRPPLVFLHGLTFDRRMWAPVLDALPAGHRAIAFDLPGHGGSPGLGRGGLVPVVDAVRDAVAAAGLDAPIVVGHSIGGPIAAIYASHYPVAGVVCVDAPIRFEPFAELLRSLRPQLEGDGFAQAWSGFRESMRLDRVPPAYRRLVGGADRDAQALVLAYQHDLLERPLPEVVAWREAGFAVLREAGTPYVSVHASPLEAADRSFLLERLPQAEIVEWPVGHHFPHLAEPERFAALLTGLAAAAAWRSGQSGH
jgi:pimeloyl-ACP methyl ester carboxylesterase